MELSPQDLIITTYQTRTGFGLYQDNGVCIVHRPSNFRVRCHHERSQHRNKHICIQYIKSYLGIKDEQ